MKKHNRGFGSLSLAMVAVLFLAIAPTHAQETAQEAAAEEKPAAERLGLTVTTSQATIQISGSASASRTGLPENVTFSGNIVINATVVTDPAVPTGVTLFVDGKGVRGVGNETGTVYINSCEANVTRLFRPTDKVTLTFAFFEDKPGSFLKSKTGVVTITLTYDEKTRKLTRATGVIGTL
ncbi:MAG: hypothetical protein M3P06_00220 [Acidobacteriota bacterium]|nr:hypothetical protein [Acidobacteriota bacterium]